VPQKTFRQLLGMVHFAMAQQDIRYYLNGMLLVVDGDQLMAVATDGHRLAFSSMKIEGGTFGRQEVIMPRKTILELQRLLEDIDDTVTIDIAQPGEVHVRRHRARVQAGRGQVPRLPARDPEGAQEHVRDRPRRAAAFAATRGDPDHDKFKGVRCIIAPGS
jgi:DNA polymerase-3 subunit beta